MGVATAAAFRPVAEVLEASSVLVALIGMGAVVWGGFVWVAARVPSWRTATTFVVVVNLAIVAAIAVVLMGVGGPTGRTVVFGAIGIQVFGFAAIQAHALWSPFGR
jgi:hypothetical protein